MIKKSLYDVALNSQGYVLVGSPENPKRVLQEAPTYGAVPTNIDYQYSDATTYFPWAQTDWSSGYQDEIWADNGKYKYGENVDPLDEYGRLKLLPELHTVLSLASGQTYSSSAIWNQKLYVGCAHATAAKLYSIDESDNTVDITTSWSNVTSVNSMCECQDKLVVALTRSSGAEHTIQLYNGSTFEDISTDYDTVRSVFSVGQRLYAAPFESTAEGDSLMYTDDLSTWTTRVVSFGRNKQVIKGLDYFGLAYFLVQDYPALELWYEDGTDVERVYRWDNLINPDIKVHNQMIFISGQTDGATYVYAWNGAQLIPAYAESEAIAQAVDSRYMVSWKSDLWLQGLRFDGKYWYTGFTYKYGANNKRPIIAYGHGASYMYFYGVDGSTTRIQRTDEDSYPTTGYVISGLFREKPAINKLWYSVDVSFAALATGESIEVQYSTDYETTWTSLGTANTIGATEATFYFTQNTKSRFIQYKIILGSGGTTTPILNDVVFRYKLLPIDRYMWQLTLRCGDNMILKDRVSEEPKYGEELRNLLRVARWNNSVVNFEDYDYEDTLLNGALNSSATTITVDSTSGFPEQGRLRIDNEEIFYTGKTVTTFTGCTRGARNTVAASHLNDATVSTLYKVLITDYKETVPSTNNPNDREYYVQITLLES